MEKKIIVRGRQDLSSEFNFDIDTIFNLTGEKYLPWVKTIMRLMTKQYRELPYHLIVELAKKIFIMLWKISIGFRQLINAPLTEHNIKFNNKIFVFISLIYSYYIILQQVTKNHQSPGRLLQIENKK